MYTAKYKPVNDEVRGAWLLLLLVAGTYCGLRVVVVRRTPLREVQPSTHIDNRRRRRLDWMGLVPVPVQSRGPASAFRARPVPQVLQSEWTSSPTPPGGRKANMLML